MMLHIFWIFAVYGVHERLEKYPSWVDSALENPEIEVLVWNPEAGIGDSLINGILPMLHFCVETETCVFTINSTNSNSEGWMLGLNPKYDWIFDPERAARFNQKVTKVTRCRGRKCGGHRFIGKMEIPSRDCTNYLFLHPSDEVKELMDQYRPGGEFIGLHQRTYAIDEFANRELTKDDIFGTGERPYKDVKHFWDWTLKDITRCVKELFESTGLTQLFIATDFDLFRTELKEFVEREVSGLTVNVIDGSGKHILVGTNPSATRDNFLKIWAEYFMLYESSAFVKPGHYTFFSESIFFLRPDFLEEDRICKVSACISHGWTNIWEFTRDPRNGRGMLPAIERTHKRSLIKNTDCYPTKFLSKFGVEDYEIRML